MQQRKVLNGIELSTDGRTVWVNGSHGGMIGRFSPRGIDVHGADDVHCLDCRPAPKENPWRAFAESMLEHHHVHVPDSFQPNWCKNS